MGPILGATGDEEDEVSFQFFLWAISLVFLIYTCLACFCGCCWARLCRVKPGKPTSLQLPSGGRVRISG